jgi:cation transport ATPase
MQAAAAISPKDEIREPSQVESNTPAEPKTPPLRQAQTLFGLLFVINAYLVDLIFDQAAIVASGSALIGALLLAFPIFRTALKDLQRGVVSINELVGIAILASFASGDYKVGGGGSNPHSSRG